MPKMPFNFKLHCVYAFFFLSLTKSHRLARDRWQLTARTFSLSASLYAYTQCACSGWTAGQMRFQRVATLCINNRQQERFSKAKPEKLQHGLCSGPREIAGQCRHTRQIGKN